MKKRRFLASFFALCMFLSASNISAFAAENEDVTVQPPIVIERYDGPLYGFEDEFAYGERSIETDVDTGATGKKGDKGRISVEGVATANKSLSGGGEFNIAYSITIP